MTAWSVIVLKFGSSVLRSAADLPGVVDEIYRHLRTGKRVLAVVSAFEGHTDKLLNESHALFGDDAPEATAHYVATGEVQAAALLSGALLKAGIAARIIDPREAQLAVHGGSLNAEPHSIDRDTISPTPRDAILRDSEHLSGGLLQLMEAMKPLVASLGADKVKRIVDLLG